MTIEFRCADCGRKLRAKQGQEGEKAHCPSCGGLTVIPALEGEEPASPAKARDEGPGTLRLADDEDAPKPRKKKAAESTCPECDEPMERGAVICIECGFDLRIGKRRKTKVKRVERHWMVPPGLVVRFVGLVAGLLVTAGICAAVAASGTHPLPVALAFVGVALLFVVVAGWYHTLHLARDPKGALLLTKRTYLCFAPIGSQAVDLGDCVAIQIDAGNSPLATAGSVPFSETMMVIMVALLFAWAGWIVIIRPRGGASTAGDSTTGSSSFAVRLLARRRRDVLLTLYSGSDEEFMRDLVDTISAQGELEIVR